MPSQRGTAALMRAGLILAAAILVVRIVLEQLGAPETVNNIFGVAWLYFVFPILFALRIATAGAPGPYKALLKDLFFFALYTRLMVMATYMLAYRFQWQAPRFGMEMGGNVGPEVTPLMGLLVIPTRNALIWVVAAILFGMILGGITLFAKRKSRPAAA